MLRNVLTTVWSRFWSWCLVKILKLKFGRDIVAEPEVWPRNESWSLVNILKLKFDQLVTWLKSSSFGESIQPLGQLCLRQYFSPFLHFINCIRRKVFRVLHSSNFVVHLTIFLVLHSIANITLRRVSFQIFPWCLKAKFQFPPLHSVMFFVNTTTSKIWVSFQNFVWVLKYWVSV